MWKEAYMDFAQSLTVSGLGLSIVFLTLVSLALTVVIFSKLFSVVGASKQDKTAGVATSSAQKQPQGNEKDEDDILAILVAVISEEVNLPIDRFQITQIKEIKSA